LERRDRAQRGYRTQRRARLERRSSVERKRSARSQQSERLEPLGRAVTNGKTAHRSSSTTHAPIVAIGYATDEVGVRAGASGRAELHLYAAVGQRLQRGHDGNAASVTADDAGAAVLRADRQALIVHCTRRGAPGAIEALLGRQLW